MLAYLDYLHTPYLCLPVAISIYMVFVRCFRWARALDLGRALPKKTCVVFSAQDAHWIVADFQKKKKKFGR